MFGKVFPSWSSDWHRGRREWNCIWFPNCSISEPPFSCIQPKKTLRITITTTDAGGACSSGKITLINTVSQSMATWEAWFLMLEMLCLAQTSLDATITPLQQSCPQQTKGHFIIPNICQGTIKKSGKSVVRAYLLKIFDGLNLTNTSKNQTRPRRCHPDMFHPKQFKIEFPTPRCLSSHKTVAWGGVFWESIFWGCWAEALLVEASPACDEHVHGPKQCHGGSAIPAPNTRNWGNCTWYTRV